MGENALHFRELTSPGAGAIRVLELSGPGALGALRALSGRDAWEPGALRLALLRPPGSSRRDSADVVDEALCHVVDRTRIELHIHGSEPVVRELRKLCQIHFGATVDSDTDNDERALDPVSSSSLEQRASSLVPLAPSDAGARILLDQASGALRAEIRRLLELEPANLRAGLAHLDEAGRVALHALRPTPVVLAGPVNAGKSTLFNLLVRRADRALMSPVPGTTRDALSEPALFGPWPVQLYDTAGTRDLLGSEPQEEIERQGQALAERLKDRADLVLLLHPADREAPPKPCDPKVRLLLSMADRLPGGGAGATGDAVSVHKDPEAAATTCHRIFAEAFQLPGEAWRSGVAAPFDEDSRAVIACALEEAGLGSDSKIESARARISSLL